MSDSSDDDFMSDKYLVDAAPPPSSSTYTARRQRLQLAGLRKSQADNRPKAAAIEAARRHAGLSRSLFDDGGSGGGGGDDDDGRSGSGSGSRPKRDAGQAKAMDLMAKMGWKVGDALGRRRSASPERRAEGGPSSSSYPADPADPAPRPRARPAEPLRISMWARRRGLAARTPSPPPPPLRPADPDALPAARLAALDAAAARFRGQVGAEAAAREAARKAAKAREILVEKDAARGVKFHPLHAVPGEPGALPAPLLALLYPEDYRGSGDASASGARSRSRSPSPPLGAASAPAPPPVQPGRLAGATVPAAERLRAQMRRDMLAEMVAGAGDGDGDGDGVDDADVRFGLPREAADAAKEQAAEGDAHAGVDWEAMVSGTKRVLAMTPEDDLAFVASQLRNEHMFCFWCAAQYASFEEMDGPGGCPGEEEDDH